MKKVISICAAFLLFILVGTIIAVGGGEVNVTTNKADPYDNGERTGLPEGGEVIGLKVSVYVGKDAYTEKESGYSSFRFVGRKIFFNSTFQKRKDKTAYIGRRDKFAYATDYINGLSTSQIFTVKTLDSNDYEIDFNIPYTNCADQDKINQTMPYMLDYINNEQSQKRFLNKFNVREDESWVMIIEPIVMCGIYKERNNKGKAIFDYYFFFTPTEYALSFDCYKRSGGTVYYEGKNEDRVYDGYYNPYTQKDRNPGLISLGNACSYMSAANGTWLGLGNSSYNADNASWTKKGNEKDAWRYTKRNWDTVKNDIFRYGGVCYIFSQAFELPDYTVEAAVPSVAWENETIEIGSTVHNSNPARGGSVNVTMTYLDANGHALQSQTKNVSMAGKTTEYVSWQINAGTYSQTGADNARSVSITVTPVGDPNKKLETNADNNSAGGELKLMRNFSVSDIRINGSASPVRITENQTVDASFTVTNHNPFRAYENIYIGVYLKKSTGAAVSLGGQSVTLAAGGTKHCKMRINVGSVTANRDQVFTVIATVNLQGVSASHGRVWVHEFEQRGGTTHTLDDNMNRRTNKGFTEGNIVVERKMSMGMQILAGTYSNRNASVTTDKRTTGMVTCLLKNAGNYNMYESNASKDRLYAQISYNGKTQTSPVVCVPAKGTNITWFKVEIPNASSITFTGKMIWKYETVYVDANGETHTKDNTKTFDANSVVAPIKPTTVHKTPDTVLDKDAAERTDSSASGYSKASAYVVNRPGYPRIAQWDQWQMSGSTFVLHRYALAGEVTKAQLNPANVGNDKEYVNVKGQIASGSAFSLDFAYGVKKQSSIGDPIKDSDFTLVQNAIARFPEFKYQNGENNSRTLFFSGNNLGASMFFDLNRSADGEQNGVHTGQRVHFTPLNMPDGTYKVAVEGYDLWTPAGMIYVIATPTLTVHGSIYDYNYMS